MRVKANYTIDDKIKAKFDELCEEGAINKSQWIEKRMIEFLKKNNVDLSDIRKEVSE